MKLSNGLAGIIAAISLAPAGTALASDIPIHVVLSHLHVATIYHVNGLPALGLPSFAIVQRPTYRLQEPVGQLDRAYFSADAGTQATVCRMLGYGEPVQASALADIGRTNDAPELTSTAERESFTFELHSEEDYVQSVVCAVDGGFHPVPGPFLPKPIPVTLELGARLIQIVPDFPGIDPFAAIHDPVIHVTPELRGTDGAVMDTLPWASTADTRDLLCRHLGYGARTEVEGVTEEGYNNNYDRLVFLAENGAASQLLRMRATISTGTCAVEAR
jgi:hypothetical protein